MGTSLCFAASFCHCTLPQYSTAPHCHCTLPPHPAKGVFVLDWLDLGFVAFTALASAFVGSVAGSGGTLVLMPVLVLYFGIQEATVLVTVANLSANLSRAFFNRRELDLKVVGWFILGAMPLSILGTWLFTITAPDFLTRLLGGFLLVMVVWRHIKTRPLPKRSAAWFFPVGAGYGFLSGLVSAAGALVAPFYLAYGLSRNAYIGTDALATAFMQSTKLATLGAAHFVSWTVFAKGLLLVPFMIVGTLTGKHLLARLSERTFALIIEAVMILAGVHFLIRG
jgi:uncharacterized protein